MRPITLAYGLISFVAVFLVTPWLIKYLRRIGLVVKDQNKEEKPLVPISGGLAVLFGIMAGLLSFIFYRTFILRANAGLIITDKTLMLMFAAMVSLLIITLVGFLDDLIIEPNKDSSAGLKQWQKPLLTLTAAIPLMAINAGTTHVGLPIFGVVELGIIYPLILIPLGVVGASNMVNMLAGFNGLETGLGLIYTGRLGLYAYFNNRPIAALIALFAFSALLAFYYYNKYPARILAGDSLTYLLGGVIAVIAILGNIERAAIISSIPFFIEFILKVRGKLKAHSFGYYKDGKIKSYYDKIYSLPHILTRTGKYTEKQIVYSLMLFQLICSSLIWVI